MKWFRNRWIRLAASLYLAYLSGLFGLSAALLQDWVSADSVMALTRLIGAAGSVLIALGLVPITWHRWVTVKQRNPGSAAVRGAARLLPQAARCRWVEEWAGELYDLRAEGVRWHRRFGYVVMVLCCTIPVLAVQLRLRPQWVVD